MFSGMCVLTVSECVQADSLEEKIMVIEKARKLKKRAKKGATKRKTKAKKRKKK
jgi:hypothetical protein